MYVVNRYGEDGRVTRAGYFDDEGYALAHADRIEQTEEVKAEVAWLDCHVVVEGRAE